MAIHIEITQPQKAAFLIELLQSLDFVSSVTTDAVEPVVDNSSFLKRHNGNLPSLDVKKFENYVTESRNEWERNIY